MDITHFAYVFAIPGVDSVKIGHSGRLKQRLYNLRWGEEASHAHPDRARGTYACVVGFRDRATALACERLCQARLRKYRVPQRNALGYGGAPEWFFAPHDVAVKALISSAKRISREKVIMNYLGAPLLALT